ncbi:hypothetical protein, partial [Carboxylicivirga taeanensis]|uniref:hypothetical protein n=1 Tax=Carboxylicivirga taeanensis TaxID=1416875 RepID=UPI003F6E07DA
LLSLMPNQCLALWESGKWSCVLSLSIMQLTVVGNYAKRNMKASILIIIVFIFSLNLTGQESSSLQKSDSLLVLQKIYTYNFESNEFEDIDEMYLEELWNSDKHKAEELFKKAIELKSAPIHERMILASYFYHSNDLKPVHNVLKSCMTHKDSISIYNIMDSYRIKFSDFNISKEQLKKYCENCKYN